MNFTSSALII